MDKEEKDPFVNQLYEFWKYIKGEENIMPCGEYSTKIIEKIESIYKCRMLFCDIDEGP